MILPISIGILIVALLMARVSYCMGLTTGYREAEQDRVRGIQKIHTAWRAGVLAERMRSEIQAREQQGTQNQN